jgi:LacI family transcriptional regulator
MTGQHARRPRPAGPRLIDVAARAGVSPGTVSHVLNHPQKVAPATRARVLAAIDELGFSRNGMASALARGDTRTIGLVVVSLSNSMFVDVARGAQRVARERDHYLHLASADDDGALFDAHMRRMNEARASGMLIAPLDDQTAAIARSRAQGCPVVVLNHDSPEHDACRVLVDNEAVGRVAAEHMIGLGRRHLAFVHARADLQPVALRRAGARAAVAAAPGVRLTELPVASLESDAGAAAGRALAALPAAERPDAVVAVTDVLGMAVLNELVAAGIAVPGEVAVMGCDHNSSAWGSAVPLTSVTMEGETMGAAAVAMLLDELTDPGHHAHTTTTLEPHLVARESTVGRP